MDVLFLLVDPKGLGAFFAKGEKSRLRPVFELVAATVHQTDGLGVHTVLLPAKLFFGDSLWSLERFYNAFVTSSLIMLALFVENVVLAIIDVVKK